jgi:TM2 domain-containing membrane protein YozV
MLPEWDRLQARRAEAEFASVRKDVRVAYALWLVTGVFGGHRFYLGDTAQSIAMLFTLGGLGVWSLCDVLFIARRVRVVNAARRAAVMSRHGIVEASWTGARTV